MWCIEQLISSLFLLEAGSKQYIILQARAVGADDESILADEFRFEFPLVKLDKKVQICHKKQCIHQGWVDNTIVMKFCWIGQAFLPVFKVYGNLAGMAFWAALDPWPEQNNMANSYRKNTLDILALSVLFIPEYFVCNLQSYLEAVRSFDFLGGVPNISSNTYDFRVDKYEPQR